MAGEKIQVTKKTRGRAADAAQAPAAAAPQTANLLGNLQSVDLSGAGGLLGAPAPQAQAPAGLGLGNLLGGGGPTPDLLGSAPATAAAAPPFAITEADVMREALAGAQGEEQQVFAGIDVEAIAQLTQAFTEFRAETLATQTGVVQAVGEQGQLLGRIVDGLGLLNQKFDTIIARLGGQPAQAPAPVAESPAPQPVPQAAVFDPATAVQTDANLSGVLRSVWQELNARLPQGGAAPLLNVVQSVQPHLPQYTPQQIAQAMVAIGFPVQGDNIVVRKG